MPSPSNATAINAPTTILSAHDSSVTSGSVARRKASRTTRSKPRSKIDRRDTPAVRERTARNPAGSEQVADSSGQHVVDGDACDDHLDELDLARPRVGDLAPAGRLEPVDAPHTGHGAEQRSRPHVLHGPPSAPRSAPRIARKRKTADAGIPMAAAIHILRRLGRPRAVTGGPCALGEGASEDDGHPLKGRRAAARAIGASRRST